MEFSRSYGSKRRHGSHEPGSLSPDRCLISPPPFPTPPLLLLFFLLHSDISPSFLSSYFFPLPLLSLPSVPVTYPSPPCLWSLLILLPLLSPLTDHL